MTSMMQRPRSPPPSSETTLRNDYNTFAGNQSLNEEHSTSAAFSSPLAPALGTSSELGEQLAGLQRELLGASSSLDLATVGHADAATLSADGREVPGGSVEFSRSRPQQEDRQVLRGPGSGNDGHATSLGLFEDPSILALVGQSSSQLDPDLELSMAAQALSSQLARDVPEPLSDLDLSSTSTFQFPELPASLLDQAPEYEYSVHTQANVFDAVQEYDPAGDDEAARIFGLDNYDPLLLEASHQVGTNAVELQGGSGGGGGGGGGGEEFWNYNGTSGGGSAPLMQSNDYTHFQDSSSLSDYPETSTAPTSRASEYKLDPMAGAIFSSSQPAYAPMAGSLPLKRRRDSFEAGLAAHPAMPDSQYSRQAYHQSLHPQELQPQHSFYAIPQSSYPDGRGVVHNPVVPSQGIRARMASWGGEGTATQYVDDWPPPPAPAPALGSMNTFGPHRGSANDFYPEIHGSMSMGMGAPNLPAGARPMNNNTATTRVSSTSSEPGRRTPHSGHSPSSSARHASQNEMINALGASMDASMESDGVAKCPYPNCTKTFAKNRSYNLKAHLRSHSQLKPFACSHCPRAFSRKHDLERHARVHSGDKPYICEACGKGFPRSDALRRHWRVEKECGDKAVEIEAGQPLPSLPPGVNTVAAQAKGPMPGMMTHNGPMATAVVSQRAGGPSQHPMAMPVHYSSFASAQPWDSNLGFVDGHTYQQQERKRLRGEY